jgi:3-deoxy-D-manno-octulosonic-acid transferase
MKSILDYLCFLFYRFILVPLAITVLKIGEPLWPPKLQRYIKSRKLNSRPPLPSAPIWIHGSSGEIEYAKSVIRALKDKWPQRQILVTYSSDSALKLLKDFPGIDALTPSPWDHRDEVTKFIQYYKPSLYLCARTDVWPEVSYQCRLNKIPSLLFAATLANKSNRKNPLARFAFNQLEQIFTVDEMDNIEFQNSGILTDTTVAGDTRYDQVFYRLKNPKINFPNLAVKTNIFIAGSTWPEDEKALLPMFADLIAKDIKIIIAPHEVQKERLEKLVLDLKLLGHSSAYYSQTNQLSHWPTNAPVLVLDQVGILQEIYSLGCIAFVGGSFKDKVHSVMEPLCAGLPVLVGPFHANNREALKFQNIRLIEQKFDLVQVCDGPEQMTSAIKRIMSANNIDLKSDLQKRMQLEGRKTELVIQWCEQALSTNEPYEYIFDR